MDDTVTHTPPRAMDGILRCSKYAFGPNRFMYCGPDANKEISEYMRDGFIDGGFIGLMKSFEVMYPYLEHIAHVNKLSDPFDGRVVEAYWLGNNLLDKVDKPSLHRYFTDTIRLKARMSLPNYRLLETRIGLGIQPCHNYHVLNVPKKMGHQEMESTVEFKDSCRISWGTVTAVLGPKITLRRAPLIQMGDMLVLGPEEEKTVMRPLAADYDIDMLAPGDTITLHWDSPCEVVTDEQVTRLKRYTEKSIAIANKAFE